MTFQNVQNSMAVLFPALAPEGQVRGPVYVPICFLMAVLFPAMAPEAVKFVDLSQLLQAGCV